MSELTKRLREHAALHGDLGRFNDEQAQWERDLLDAADYIDNDEARGVHSCHNRCQRLECVQRREIDRLNAKTLALVAEISGLRRQLAEARGRLRLARLFAPNWVRAGIDEYLTASDQPDAVKPCADCGEPTDVWHDGTHLCWKCRA